jgi:O-antigen/teichoic acid export membrane protein
LENVLSQLYKGSIVRSLHFAFNVISSFFLMPFLINSLGERWYGIWILISSFLTFYWLFNIGLGPATQRYVSMCLGKNDFDGANEYINTSIRVYKLIGLAVAVFTTLATVAIPWMSYSNEEKPILQFLILCLGLNFALSMPMRVFSGLIAVHLRYDILSGIGLCKDIVRVVLIVCFLKMGYGLVALAVIHVVTDSIDYTLSYFYARKIAGYFRRTRRKADRDILKRLFNYSWIALGIQITDRLRFNTDTFVIAAYLGAEKITQYTIAFRLTEYFRQFIASAIGMLMPVFSRMDAEGDRSRLIEKFMLATKISVYLSVFLGGSLLIFGKDLIEIWVGKQYADVYPLLVILIIPATINFMQIPSMDLLYGLSRHRDYLAITGGEAACNLILNLILVREYGLIGAAIGNAIPVTLWRIAVQPFFTCKVLQIDMRVYMGIMGSCLVKGTVLVFGWHYFVVSHVAIDSLLRLVSLWLIFTLVYGLIIGIVGFPSNERKYLVSVLMPAVKTALHRIGFAE